MSAEVAQMDALGRLGVAIKRIDSLKAALKPFADAYEAVGDEDKQMAGEAIWAMKIQDVLFGREQPTINDLRQAHTVLATLED